jgi:sortase (surface protein transpeptidase)
MKLYKKLQITSFVVVAAGMLLLAPLSYLWLHEKIALATPPTVYVPAKAPLPADQPGMVSGTPDEIKILSLHMDLPVINGYYNAQNGQWTLTLNKAQYATPSVPPNNESGNTLIYGHYRTEVFAYLHLIKPGAEADVITNNGLTFKYTFQSSQPLQGNEI